ncbi:ribbon-helix-helix domain-containing protein [Nanoarchaeota archaeon]
METISLKLDGNMLRNVDKKLKKHNYSTRTEFIRDAIRDKLEGLTKEEAIELFLNFRPKRKKGTENLTMAEIKEIAFKEMLKEKGWD